MSEARYDFRRRHWEYHKPFRRDPERKCKKGEVLLTEEWAVGYDRSEDSITAVAARDFRDYLEKSMELSLPLVHQDGPNVVWLTPDPAIDRGFIVQDQEEADRGAAHLSGVGKGIGHRYRRGARQPSVNEQYRRLLL